MVDFKIAAQLFTVRELLQKKSKEEIYEVLKTIKQIGYSAVQISAVGEIDMKLAETYRDICSDLELKICATHTNYNKLDTELDWIIEYHKMWDCTKVGIGMMPSEFQSKEGVKEFG